jgi:glycosyltransferase involved in cell wall biosynthesis
MKKIIISSYDSPKNPFYAGGGARAVHEVAKRILSDYSVLVLTSSYPNSKDEIIDNVSYRYIGLGFLPPKLSQLFFQFLLPFYTFSMDFDVWIESFTPPFSTAFLQLFTKNKVIGLIHLLSGQNMQKKYYGIPFHRIESIGLKTYKYFICLTSITKDSIRKYNHNASIEIISNGVPLEYLNMPIKRKNNAIIYIGRIEQQKGLDFLIRLFNLIAKESNIELNIAGNGSNEEESRLKGLISESKYRDRIHFLGKIYGQEKMEIFSNSLVFILPSRYETLPLTVLESFSFGVPIIISDIKDLSWIPNNICLRIDTSDLEKSKAQVKAFLSKKKVLENMSIEAKQYAQQYSWENIAAKYIKYINKVLETK